MTDEELYKQARAGLLSRGVVGRLADIKRAVQGIEPLASTDRIERIAQLLLSNLHGLGPLQELLLDSAITDICVNGPGEVWVERDGVLAKSGINLSAEDIDSYIERIVAPLGLRADRLAPLVDARLPDGSRVHIALPPLAIDGPYVAIRRFRERPYALSDMCGLPMLELLAQAINDRKNIVVCGATGAGKTSLLNALAEWIPDQERIATIEDTAELRLNQPNVVRLESRPANVEGVGAVSMRELIRASLRLRPDRIVVGEVRGAEAFDMVQALNTGHSGSLSTIHANSVASAPQRLATLCLLAEGDLPHSAALELVRHAVDMFVHVRRDADGSRWVDEVWDVRNEDLYVRDERKDAA